jgi:hypothetical protein
MKIGIACLVLFNTMDADWVSTIAIVGAKDICWSNGCLQGSEVFLFIWKPLSSHHCHFTTRNLPRIATCKYVNKQQHLDLLQQ